MYRPINGFVVEGADQQGKTTVVDKFVKTGRTSYKFGVPDEHFDFSEDYKTPFKNGFTVYDRSFVSEIVYSSVMNRLVRVIDKTDLEKFFSTNRFVFLFLERKNYNWSDREEEYTKDLNSLFIDRYREEFTRLHCEKYFLDPEDEKDSKMIDCMVENNYSPRRLLQEIYRHDVWKMIVSCIMLNKTNRTQVDKIRCDFFFKYSSSESFLMGNKEEIKIYLSSLGFKNRRYDMIKNFSEDFLLNKDIKDCRNVDKYASDSYEIFCKGNYSVKPIDLKLKEFLLWKASSM